MIENISTLRYSDIFYQEIKMKFLKISIIDEDRFLIRNNVPIGVVWRGNLESSSFYAYLANLNTEIIEKEKLEEMNMKFQDSIPNAESLKLAIAPLLQIVESGWYKVFYQNGKSYNFDTSYDFKLNSSCVWVEETIFPTQDWNNLNQERVDYYKELIEKGNQPTILTLAIANYENLSYNEFK